MKFSIQKFTSFKGGKTINVNVGDIFAIHPNDGSVASGATYDGAGALIVTKTGYYMPVKEELPVATDLWLNGLKTLAGNA